jgi:tetratricopeptide (TPR) repeat protein
LFDVIVWFILRAAMTLWFNFEISKLLLAVMLFLVCGLAAPSNAVAQAIPKDTRIIADPRPASPPPRRRPPRPIIPTSSKTPASVESDKFFNLGNGFRDQQKWNAAEASYKEAVTVWSGNVNALVELGYLYIDRNRIEEAQQTYNKLRSINSSAASDLLAEITRFKNALAH